MTDEPVDEPIDEPTERADASDGAVGSDEPVNSSAGERVVESDVESEDERYRGATPPGYDWPTHGGYLGCLLGVMIACLLAPLGYIAFGFVGAFLVQPLGGFGVALAVILTVGAYLAIFVALTRLGWSMGKRFLREYEQPVRPIWGEDDDERYPRVVDADLAPSASEPPAEPPAEPSSSEASAQLTEGAR
ncbi:MAG TPA: hypothetical protein VE338_13455 [Ktedonobacterales bacterium]|nr:hypothetical protein [Ktedonobacterales bacterium]